MLDPEKVLIAVAIGGTSIAIYTDLKWRIIPNKLTYSLITLGIVLNLAIGLHQLDAWKALSGVAGAAISFAIGYALWLTGGWAGGDVKLFTAYGALLPFYAPPGMRGLPYPFFITILFNSVIVAIPVIAVYAVIRKALGKSVFYDTVRIEDLEEGMIPAELIYERNGKIFRSRSMFGIRPLGVKVYADPSRAAGLTKAQIRVLRRLAREGKIKDELKLKRGMPFAPLLATGLVVGIFYGDLYWKLLFAVM